MRKSIWRSLLGIAFSLAVSMPASAQPARGQVRGQVALAFIPVDVLTGPFKLSADPQAEIEASQGKAVNATTEAQKTGDADGRRSAAPNAVRSARQAASREIMAGSPRSSKARSRALSGRSARINSSGSLCKSWES